MRWLDAYAESAGAKGFITGISGGIDSALTSTLCARTGKNVLAVSMPIHQKPDQLARANEHCAWLKQNFGNAQFIETDLTAAFEATRNSFPADTANHALSMANTRARLRMLTLYALGQSNQLLVAGTGNKIEDFGVGFYTKYGDGGVDLSPIADLTKSEVFALAKAIGVVHSIQVAKPTDGLWEAERTDEDQLGATYPELEWAMAFIEMQGAHTNRPLQMAQLDTHGLTERQIETLAIYMRFNNANRHKMDPIPVCIIPPHLK